MTRHQHTKQFFIRSPALCSTGRRVTYFDENTENNGYKIIAPENVGHVAISTPKNIKEMKKLSIALRVGWVVVL